MVLDVPGLSAENYGKVLPEAKDFLKDWIVGLDAASLPTPLKPTEDAWLTAFIDVAVAAVCKNPRQARAFFRLYTAGPVAEPFGIAPPSWPEVQPRDPLNGLGIHDQLHAFYPTLDGLPPEAKPWAQIAFVLGVLEGRMRPTLLSLAHCLRIANGTIPAGPTGAPLKSLHDSVRETFYEVRPKHYDTGPQDMPSLVGFTSARQLLKTEISRSTPAISKSTLDQLEGFRSWLRQNTKHPETGVGGTDFEEARHSIAHMNLAWEGGNLYLDRGRVVHEFLSDNYSVKISRYTAEGMKEDLEALWRLFILTWLWDCVLASLDFLVSAYILRDEPYPQANGEAKQLGPSHSTMLRAIGAISRGKS